MSSLLLAYEDLKYLLNRGYRKKYALEFVANHYRLSQKERHFLFRCVFSDREIEERKAKLLQPGHLKGKILGIDGFNVLITLESLLEGKAILCEDGLLRDLKLQGGYKISSRTLQTLSLLMDFLKTLDLKEVWFLYDAPVSKSGKVAELTRELLNKYGVSGKVKLSKVPDYDLKAFEVVASSDIGIVEKVPFVVDLPQMIAEKRGLKYSYFVEILKNPKLLGF
ncbi:hypothetical protein OCC_06706 [Thermococcus litoralis DSM 5473]|uniref:DUF434 domain-containing protein n=1 Tax=Thermococcus litoralis (strain ATCC 51850 / DSM 5473 / JCM 8560 / NS-C) TaxID=523849 RepID=H3ZM12_THELN|nr:DUF434 domain-containing protein [Thermococcus litoralis]EHR78956.1 hypothetical protein OCC_06706 [Thermococcus litoralis DSM 5473]